MSKSSQLSYRRSLLRQWALSLAGATLSLALQHAAAQAATITVTTPDPAVNLDSHCSLLEALVNANQDGQPYADCAAGNGADTIVLAGGRYTLTLAHNQTDGANGLPSVTSSITISGNGAVIARAATAPTFRLWHVDDGGTLTLNAVTITGGDAANTGVAARFQYGGAIYNQGTLHLVDCTVSGNQAGLDGGALANYGVATITNSTLSGNVAGRDGGGLINNGFTRAATVTLLNSTLSGNAAGRDGGGVANFAYRGASLLQMTHTTLTGNQATRHGGGLVSDAPTTLVNSLLAGNQAGGKGAEVHRMGRTFTVAAYNLFGQLGQTTAAALSNVTLGATDHTATSDGTQPTLLDDLITSTLATQGGATATHALPLNSPAIDGVPVASCGVVNQDQRGVGRPQGAACDIGAFEHLPAVTNTHIVLDSTPKVAYVLDPDALFAMQSPAGVFTILATFRNTETLALHGVYFLVTQLTSGNYLLDASDGPGQVGATWMVADAALPGGDQRWAANETLAIPFRIGLGERRRFSLRVDVYAFAAAERQGVLAQRVGQFIFAYNPNDYITPPVSKRIFLPLLVR
ncbi:MAG: hypothetical protein KF832_03215 [Caldilineaceae bacterium]|nr:hypothetical protein [Caldilineaceae bacterium]